MLNSAINQLSSAVQKRLSGALPAFEDLARKLERRGADAPSSLSTGTAPRSWWEAANQRSDPLLNVYWYCDLPDINGVSCPWNFVEEVTLPFVEFEQVSHYRAGKNKHFPSHYNISTLSLRLYEDSQGTASRYANAWQSQIINKDTGLINVASQFKKPIKVTVLNVRHATVLVLEYSGCWLQSSDNVVLTSGNSQAVVRNLTISVDELIVKFGDFSSGSSVNSLIDNIGKDFPASLPKLPSAFPSVFNDISSVLFR